MTDAPYKLIAIDLDGTLLCPDGAVSPRVKRAVHSALKEGLLVCFATGRNFTECRSILQAVDHYATAVFVGGAVVMDTGKKLTLHRTLMDPQLARAVSERIEKLGLAALALQEPAPDGMDYLVTDGIALNQATDQWMTWNRARVQRVPALARHPHPHTMRISICADSARCADVQSELLAHFGQRIICHSLLVTAYGMAILEVFDPAVNKWQGIRHVADAHGIADHEIVAIGDDVNDLPMIRHAGLGVAMGNARPEVRQIADRVIGANHEDGLAVFLEELIAEQRVRPLEQTDIEAARSPAGR